MITLNASIVMFGTKGLLAVALILGSFESLKCLARQGLVAPLQRRIWTTLELVTIFAAVFLPLFSWFLIPMILLGCRLGIVAVIDGPVCGGSDTILIYILMAACWANLYPDQSHQVLAVLGSIGVVSYFLSGFQKLLSNSWVRGSALSEILEYGSYGVPEGLRLWSQRHKFAVRLLGYGAIGFELVAPIVVLMFPAWTLVYLGVGAIFHGLNFWIFGLNRFFWAWICVYPSVYFLGLRFQGV